MKHRTDKRPVRSRWTRWWRWVRGWIEELTRNEYAGLPQTLDDFNAGRKR